VHQYKILLVKDCGFDDVMLDQILALTPDTAPLLELDLSYNRIEDAVGGESLASLLLLLYD
jgi:hypothetical protein